MKKTRNPKVGDKVSAKGQSGAFVVAKVYENHTAILAKIGSSDLPLMAKWGELSFLDELDESQNALRVVREATEGP
jgi:hypothetical protein